MRMASDSIIKTGFFLGDGTNTASFNIGFKPDVVIVDAGLDYAITGWVGIGNIIIVKDMIAYNARHNNTSSIEANLFANTTFGNNHDEYGADANVAYCTYGSYNGNIFSIGNVSDNNPVKFINGHKYSWVAIKY